MTQIHPYWLIIVSFAVATIPILVGLATAYLKVSVVLGMLKSGLGAQQVPGGLVIMALSLAMTLYIMGPVVNASTALLSQSDTAIFFKEPSVEKLSAFVPALKPWKEFLSKHSGERELKVLRDLRGGGTGEGSQVTPPVGGDTAKTEAASPAAATDPKALADPPAGEFEEFRVLLPAFVLTEIKEAFAMAFVLLLPFLVIDLVIANVLAGMGMFMVSPTMISLPLKLILFVVADGWLLLTRGLVQSYAL